MAEETKNPFLARIEAIEAAWPESGFNLVEIDEYEEPGEELHVLAHYDDRGEAKAALDRARELSPEGTFYVYAAEGEEPIEPAEPEESDDGAS